MSFMHDKNHGFRLLTLTLCVGLLAACTDGPTEAGGESESGSGSGSESEWV